MQPRAPNGIDMMIAQAKRKLQELKELQFFGGDSLNLKRWSHDQSIPLDFTKHCWQVVMTPANPTTSMPFSAEIKPATSSSYINGQIESVHRTDDKYEWLFIMGEEFPDGPAQIARFVIEYSGVAEFTITQLG